MQIASLGCGNMAASIVLGAYEKLGQDLKVYCYTPSQTRAQQLSSQAAGVHLTSLDQLKGLDLDFIMVACKPQQVGELSKSLSGLISNHTHIVSILAGMEIASLQKLFNTPVVTRIMPSTPTLVGKGISLVCHAPEVSSNQKQTIEQFFSSCSKVFPMESEAQLDTVTTVSGCGPAYVFNFAAALAKALTAQGIEQSLASEIVRALFTGASALMEYSNDLTFAELQAQVTSKGGITMEAIKVFDNYDLGQISSEAIIAALNRTKELQNLSKNI